MLDEDAQDAVFQALGHATRRRLLDLLKTMPGATVNDVAKYFEISRIAVMKHLGVLEAADLVISRKVGRTRQLYFNAVPLQMIHDRWATDYAQFWAGRVMDLKYQLEGLAVRNGDSVTPGVDEDKADPTD
jgi:DNA-binding transcriptional ArsR family regulator